MTRLIYALLVMVPLVSSANRAPAQTPSAAAADSVELAAARYAKQHLPVDGRTVAFDARTRAGNTLARTRSASQSDALAKALGGRREELACAIPKPGCGKMIADIVIALQTPKFVGTGAEIVVETHTRSGTGNETYAVERDGAAWRVSKVLTHQAVSGVRPAPHP